MSRLHFRFLCVLFSFSLVGYFEHLFLDYRLFTFYLQFVSIVFLLRLLLDEFQLNRFLTKNKKKYTNCRYIYFFCIVYAKNLIDDYFMSFLFPVCLMLSVDRFVVLIFLFLQLLSVLFFFTLSCVCFCFLFFYFWFSLDQERSTMSFISK